MKKHGAATLLGLLCLALAAGVALAGSSAHYAIDWDVVAEGGNEMSSAHYVIKSTAGQGAIGYQAGASHRLGAGYWYGLGPVQPPLRFIFLPLVLRTF